MVITPLFMTDPALAFNVMLPLAALLAKVPLLIMDPALPFITMLLLADKVVLAAIVVVALFAVVVSRPP